MQPLDSDRRPSYDDVQVSISRTISLFVLLSYESYPNTALYHGGSACPCLSKAYRRRNVIAVAQSGMFSEIMA